MYEQIREPPVGRRSSTPSGSTDEGVVDDARRRSAARRPRGGLWRRALATARERQAAAAGVRASAACGRAWRWAGDDWSADTRVPAERLRAIADAATAARAASRRTRGSRKLLDERAPACGARRGASTGAAAEMLAYGSLLLEGSPVRLCGQDSLRGTFSHRHAVAVRRQERPTRTCPLNHLARRAGARSRSSTARSARRRCSASSTACRAGRSAAPGDVGGAVRRLRQRRAGDRRSVHRRARESKWQRMSGIVLLLPHGYEGQGPEHSSARLERFLQLCADGQHAGGQLHDAGAVLPRAAPADAPHLPQAADRDDAQEPAAPPARGVHARRARRRAPSSPSSTTHAWRARGRAARAAVLRARSSIRSTSGRDESGTRRRRARARRAALPLPGTELHARCARYPQRTRGRVGAGGAGQPGARGCSCGRGSATCSVPHARCEYVGRDEAASPATGNYKIHQAEEAAIRHAGPAAAAAPSPATSAPADEGEKAATLMAVDIRIPQLGESVSEGVIVQLAQEGRRGRQGRRALLELETDKAAMEIAAEAAGQLQIIEPEGAARGRGRGRRPDRRRRRPLPAARQRTARRLAGATAAASRCAGAEPHQRSTAVDGERRPTRGGPGRRATPPETVEWRPPAGGCDRAFRWERPTPATAKPAKPAVAVDGRRRGARADEPAAADDRGAAGRGAADGGDPHHVQRGGSAAR